MESKKYQHFENSGLKNVQYLEDVSDVKILVWQIIVGLAQHHLQEFLKTEFEQRNQICKVKYSFTSKLRDHYL